LNYFLFACSITLSFRRTSPSDRRKMKEMRVLELHDQGYTYRKISDLVHLSLRDVTKVINLTFKSPSVTTIHDEIILEYRVNGLGCEVRDLKIEKENLMRKLNDLRAQKHDLQIQVFSKQSQLDTIKWNLENEKFSMEILNDV
jgi:hypothetical protein